MITDFTPDLVPDTIRETPRWLVWRWEERDGKLTKPPYQAAAPDVHATSTDPTTWAPFATACETAIAGRADGIGVALGDSFAGIDIDDCRHPDTGRIAPWAQAIIDTIDSYTEVSPSKAGVKIFVRINDAAARLPGRKHTRADSSVIEMYTGGKYFTVTTWHVPGTPRDIRERSTAFRTLHAQFFPPPPPSPSPSQDRPLNGTTLEDDAVIRLATTARNAEKFSRLWAGDTSDYQGDDSSADLALCALLRFWTGDDAARIDRLFRRSGLMREKWSSPRGDSTYGAITIQKAIDYGGDTYADAPPSDADPAPADAGRHVGPLPYPAVELEDASTVALEGRAIAKAGVRYLVQDLVPAYGELGFLVAFTKVGKTTFGQGMGAAVSKGVPFLDRATTRCRVLVLAPEDPPEYTAWLARHLDVEPGWMTFRRKPTILTDAELERICATVTEWQFGFVLIASWQAVIRGLLRDENDNAGAVAVVERVKAAARLTGIPWLIDAHSGKGENQDDDADPSMAMRGASGAAGAADYTLSLRYANGAFGSQRRLSGKGRFVNFAPLTLELDPASNTYSVIGSTKDATRDSTWRLILETGAITSTPRTIAEIARAAGLVPDGGSINGKRRKQINDALRNRPDVLKAEQMKRGQKTTLFCLVGDES